MDGNTQAICASKDEMKQLIAAAISGKVKELPDSASANRQILLSKTDPKGGTCLHISSAFGHVAFSVHVVELNPSLLAAENWYGETALIVAITNGRVALALTLLGFYKDLNLTAAILADDNHGNNALHHAISNGHTDIALALIIAEQRLSKDVNIYGDSPMFIAVMKGSTEISKRLLDINGSSAQGGNKNNALHAAVKTGHQELAKMIMTKRPLLAQQENSFGNTPLREAVVRNEIKVIRELLQQDRSLGYHISQKDGLPPLFTAAYNGNVGAAEEILKHCPDAPYDAPQFLNDLNPNLESKSPNDPKNRYGEPAGMTCLHTAVYRGHINFVEFILASPALQKLINVQDSNVEE